jgi:response regulator RpfG family c-di-GMP phosphodiesterase
VDDEVAILDGLRRQLRRSFDVHTATGAAAALELLAGTPVLVVVSDMRMPDMDGAAFLAEVRVRHPDAVRILLTGHADTQAAIAAVNHGHVFRFLTKPCPPDVLADEVRAAVELSRFRSAENDLLATTLRRTVEALVATLSLAQPAAFARAQRVTRTVTELAESLSIAEPWEAEITAMLAFLGMVSLPPQVLAKMDAGHPLAEDEQEMVARVPSLSRSLVASIPRLDQVAHAIDCYRLRFDGVGAPPGAPIGVDLPIAARILRVAMDFDHGRSQRPSVQDTLHVLSADDGGYDPQIVAALREIHGGKEPTAAPRVVTVDEMGEGMTMWEDVFTSEGVLLIGRGTVVTESLVHRLENYVQQDRIRDPIRVVG